MSRCRFKPTPILSSNEESEYVEKGYGITRPTELPEDSMVTIRPVKLLSKGFGKAHAHGYSHAVP